jgi:hypothetical protein
VNDCEGDLFQALGLDTPTLDPSQLEAQIQRLGPNNANDIVTEIIQQCGQLAVNTIGVTCGMATSDSVLELTDLILCALNDVMALATTSCQAAPDALGNVFIVQQINGCPEFEKDGGVPDAGTSSQPPVLPVNGAPQSATATIAPASVVSVSGSDVSPVSVQPTGTISAGRSGPLLLLSDMNVSLPSVSISVMGSSMDLTGGFVKLSGGVMGGLTPDPAFSIPSGAFNTIVTGTISGRTISVNATNPAPMVGQYREDSGLFELSGTLQLQGLDDAIDLDLAFNFDNRPPHANAGPDQVVECTLSTHEAVIQLSGAMSVDHDSGDSIASYAWKMDQVFVAEGPNTVTASTLAGLGSHVVELLTTDTHGSASVDTAVVKVVDTTPPAFGALPSVTVGVCGPGIQAATIPTPTATDACSLSVAVTGTVVASNGVTLAAPIPVTNGTAVLATGTYTVQWTAKDDSGNTSTAQQTVNVRPAIEASDAISIDDRSVVVLAGGGFAALGNTGTGTVTVGVQAQTGEIDTKSGVFLRNYALVHGNVRAGGALSTQTGATVTGTVSQNGPVTLAPGRSLAGVTFPGTNAGPITLQPGTAQTIAPGAYAAVTAYTGSTLTLKAGTYYFTSLDLEPQASLKLDETQGAIKLFVQTSVIDRGTMVPAGGAIAGFVLGYAGTAALNIQSPFPGGVVIAPNADVVISSLGSTAFAGQLFAKDIEIQPDATLTCTPVAIGTP